MGIVGLRRIRLQADLLIVSRLVVTDHRPRQLVINEYNSKNNDYRFNSNWKRETLVAVEHRLVSIHKSFNTYCSQRWPFFEIVYRR